MEEIHESRSQCDYAESFNDKLENKFIMIPQRKITEDKVNEESFENSAECKNEQNGQNDILSISQKSAGK